MVGSFMRMLARVLAVLTRRRDDQDLEQELDAHLAMLVDDYRRAGLSERDALRAAMVAVGGRAQLREEHRRTRGLQWFEDFIVDPFDNRVAQPTVYATREQHPRANLALIIRTAGDPALMQEAVRKTVSAFDPDQALAGMEPLEKLAPADVAPDRLRSLLLSTFAAIAVALAALGLYGVVAHAVAHRTREIGIRLALGARRLDVGMLVVRQTMTLVARGLVAGVGLALLVSRALRAFLYGAPAVDVASFLAVAGLLTGVALIASYVPARHATIIDPLKALRQE